MSDETSLMRRRRPTFSWRMVAAGGVGAAVLKPTRVLAIAEGWAMVERRGATTPFVIPENEWAHAPREGE